ncbi:hypothetical protein [Jiangella endophytica]|uniref:hypothetical protein n=1 Tax=Jiangella endophytica TaxID=1623398 RepID=UPI001300873C|nr:hypothetical protein [Jiangella endophytica]
MPSYNAAVADPLEAAEAARALAHLTQDMDSPEATYRVLGALSSTLWSLRQSLDQLAAWHERNADRAYAIDAPPPGGAETSRQVADDLRFAALSVARAGAHVDKGWNRNGRILWAQGPDRPTPSSVATHDQVSARTQSDGLGR